MINNNGEIAQDCGFLSTLSCCLCRPDKVILRPCCFIPLSKCSILSLDDFFNKTFKELSDLRPFNKNDIDCKFKCNLRPVDTLEINFLYKCNLKCHHCISEAPSNKEDVNITKNYILKIFDKIINEGYHFNKIHLDGSGEIFIIYKDLKKYLKRLSKDIVNEIMFATNATLLTEDVIKELCEISESTGVKFSFDISLDGITKETFEATRVGASFEKVINNIKNLRPHFEYMLSFTAKQPNITDNPRDVISFFKELGAIYPTIRYDALDENIKQEYMEKYRDLLSC